MKKKVFLLSMITAGTLAIGVATFVSANDSVSPFISYGELKSGDTKSLVLDKNQAPSAATSDYKNNITGTFTTALGNEVKMKFVNAKQLADGFVQLANHGKIYNFDGGDAVTGFNKISFAGEGSLLFKPVLPGGILVETDPVSVVPGIECDVPACDYFEIEAGDEGASITSLTLSYSCDATEANVQLLDGTYTGIGNDGYTYKLVVSNGEAHIRSLDMQTNLELDGTVAMVDKDTAKCTFSYQGATIYYTMDFDGHSFIFVSKSSVPESAAALVAQVSFDRVYNVEDFESYTKTGTGYVSAEAKYTTTGMRSQYYADYYTGGGSSEIGGSGWQIMTSTDNSNWRNNKGRNGSAGGIFKFSNGMGMRYISMNELYGVKSMIGKGSTLSFWARGAYTDTNFNVNHSSDTSMKLYAFYDSPLVPSTQTTVRETYDFTVTAGATWQHFEMSLTAGRKYYGFGFFAQQKSGSTQYVPIDDIEIYTASPYAEHVAPVAVTGVDISQTELDLVVGGTSQLSADVHPSDATNKSVTWFSDDPDVVTVDSNGLVTAVAEGSATVFVSTVDGGYSDTCDVTVSIPSYPEGTYQGTVTTSLVPVTMCVAFGNESNGLVGIRVQGQDAGATGVTYNSVTKEFSIATTGSYMGLSFGTVSGVFDAENNKLINISCDGDIKAQITNNGEIVASTFISASNYWNCDGSTEQLQSVFARRYGDPWTVDTINGDRLTSDTTHFVNGTGAMKVRCYTGGRYSLAFANDFSPAKVVTNIQFWVYNPSNEDVTLRMFYYKSTGYSNHGETGSVIAKANGWTYANMGFGSQTIYNFQIAHFDKINATLTFDSIALY